MFRIVILLSHMECFRHCTLKIVCSSLAERGENVVVGGGGGGMEYTQWTIHPRIARGVTSQAAAATILFRQEGIRSGFRFQTHKDIAIRAAAIGHDCYFNYPKTGTQLVLVAIF